MFLYVLALLKQMDADGANNPVTSIVCALASLLLVFVGFARLNRQQTYFALKGMDFLGDILIPGSKEPGFITEPLRG